MIAGALRYGASLLSLRNCTSNMNCGLAPSHEHPRPARVQEEEEEFRRRGGKEKRRTNNSSIKREAAKSGGDVEVPAIG